MSSGSEPKHLTMEFQTLTSNNPLMPGEDSQSSPSQANEIHSAAFHIAERSTAFALSRRVTTDA